MSGPPPHQYFSPLISSLSQLKVPISSSSVPSYEDYDAKFWPSLEKVFRNRESGLLMVAETEQVDAVWANTETLLSMLFDIADFQIQI